MAKPKTKPKRIREFGHDPGDTTDVDVVLLTLDPPAWRALRRGLTDPQALRATYRGWSAQQQASRADAVAKGYRVHERAIDVAAALAWCHERKLPLAYRSIAKHLLEVFSAGSARPTRPTRRTRKPGRRTPST